MTIAVRLWIVGSAWLVGTGWILSAFQVLNVTGYLASFALFGLAVFWWLKDLRSAGSYPRPSWGKLYRRFKRPLPLLFLLIAGLNLACGLLVGSQNGDSSAYRIPRVFHWLGNAGWQWIHTGDSRMNIAACGFEWLYAPLILFARSDRWVPLPNLISYLLLPGLIFSVFRQLRISPRVAWWWMWILAGGWCYALQACSTLNDGLGVIYALAAAGFALRAREAQSITDLWFSLLAAGLLSGLKQTNLPLLLPWAIAVWPAARLLLQRPAASLAVILAALLVSAVPLSYLDWAHTGSWTGFPKAAAGQTWAWGAHQELTSPFWGLVGNAFCLPAQNLLPFFFPKAAAWNHALEQFVQTPLGSHFQQFEVFGRLGRSVSEATAGIGLGVVVLTLAAMVAVRCQRSPARVERAALGWHLRLLYAAPWISLLVFMAKVGTYQNARQAAPYYVLLFPLLLTGVPMARLTRQHWWQRAALVIMALTAVYVGFVRARIMVPVNTLMHFQESHPHSKVLAVLSNTLAARISVNAQRNHFKPMLPMGEKVIGYATTVGGAEPGLWMPFGQRRVQRVLAGDTPEALQKEGIHYVIVEDLFLDPGRQPLDQWCEMFHGTLVDSLDFTRDPGSPPGHLYLVRLGE